MQDLKTFVVSGWVKWQRARWEGKPVPDHFIDADGNFYCDCGCTGAEEHRERTAPKASGADATTARLDHDTGWERSRG